jgi:hypothetical protein
MRGEGLPGFNVSLAVDYSLASLAQSLTLPVGRLVGDSFVSITVISGAVALAGASNQHGLATGPQVTLWFELDGRSIKLHDIERAELTRDDFGIAP